jgi:hypothetical protein
LELTVATVLAAWWISGILCGATIILVLRKTGRRVFHVDILLASAYSVFGPLFCMAALLYAANMYFSQLEKKYIPRVATIFEKVRTTKDLGDKPSARERNTDDMNVAA